MALRFLCRTHRHALMQDSQQAQLNWQYWMDQGCQLYEQQQYREAIKFLGCAFELADHLLEQQLPETETAVSRFTYSSICLARAFEQINEQDMRQQVLAHTEERLSDNVSAADSYEHLTRCKNSVKNRADSRYWINTQLLHTSSYKAQASRSLH